MSPEARHRIEEAELVEGLSQERVILPVHLTDCTEALVQRFIETQEKIRHKVFLRIATLSLMSPYT